MEVLKLLENEPRYFVENKIGRKIRSATIALYHFSLHVAFVYGIYLMLKNRLQAWTYLWTIVVFAFGGIGTGAGSHIYFSHHSFKATRAFKIFLIFCQTVSGQMTIHYWVQTHRVHHKFTDTDRDPTNINRGFFFSYVGFYFLPRHPECQKEWDRIDLSDLETDEDIMFQYKHYVILYSLITIGLPTIIPSIFWKESLWIAFSMNLFRFAFNFSYVGLANSISHSVGTRPYDGNLSATENNFMFYWTFGEGYHNYHHAFPLDYRSPHSQGILTTIIEICAKFGWIYDLKLSSPEIVASRMKRTGDGSIEIPSKQL